MNALLVIILLFAITLRSNDSAVEVKNAAKCPDSLLSEMYRGYKIKRIAAEAILGKKRQKHQDIICIKKNNSDDDIKYSAPEIKIYTGGSDGFVWQIYNTLYMFDDPTSTEYQWLLPNFTTIYDVIFSKNKAYLYCYNDNQEILCVLNLKNMKSKQFTFTPKKQCLILKDQYCRYVTNCDKYALIEGLPQYSPSLLVANFFCRQTVGIFKCQPSNKHIALSHDLRKYARHNEERFQLYNYINKEKIIYDIDKQIFKELQLNKILFAATDDVLILQGHNKLLLISFAENQHWLATNSGKRIMKVFPHIESGKTIIQSKRGNFGYLEYAHETNEFKIIPI